MYDYKWKQHEDYLPALDIGKREMVQHNGSYGNIRI
jgi:hypothetical protein